MPLAVKDSLTGLGSPAHEGALTLLAWPGAAVSRFALHEASGAVDITARTGELRFSALPNGA